MEPRRFVSQEDLAALTGILLDARARYPRAAVERLEEAFLIVAGLKPPPVADPLQRPEILFPGLTARPWHDPARYPAVTILEQGWKAIRDELLRTLEQREGFQPYRQERDFFVPEGRWKAMYFTLGATRFEDNRRLCPETSRILDAVPRLAELAMFSALTPGGHIRPHYGPWNCRITFHLGLVVPPGCTLRVGTETRAWEEGRCLAFDDSFEHEAWNPTSAARFVLLLDVWHPDLTDVEIAVLEQVRTRVGPEQSAQVIERIRAERNEDRGRAWWQ
jgi:aspartate beta-hydroxylase